MISQDRKAEAPLAVIDEKGGENACRLRAHGEHRRVHLDPGRNAEQWHVPASREDIARGAVAAGEEDEGAALPRHQRRGRPGVLGTGRRPGAGRDERRREAGSRAASCPIAPPATMRSRRSAEARSLANARSVRCCASGTAPRRRASARTAGPSVPLRPTEPPIPGDRVDDQSEAPAMIASHSISTR